MNDLPICAAWKRSLADFFHDDPHHPLIYIINGSFEHLGCEYNISSDLKDGIDITVFGDYGDNHLDDTNGVVTFLNNLKALTDDLQFRCLFEFVEQEFHQYTNIKLYGFDGPRESEVVFAEILHECQGAESAPSQTALNRKIRMALEEREEWRSFARACQGLDDSSDEDSSGDEYDQDEQDDLYQQQQDGQIGFNDEDDEWQFYQNINIDRRYA
jgi:hypothetical protein